MSGDLVFQAVIEAIEVSPVSSHGGFLDWIVRTRVDHVIAGQFEGERFAFRIHSPSRAGLEVGKQCTVTATWNGSGYDVDENQWRVSPHR